MSFSFLSLSIFVGSLLSSPSFHNIHYDHTKSREIKKSTTDRIYARQENTTHCCSTLPYTESRASEPKAYFTNTYTTKTENSARKRASKRERYNWKEHYSTVTRRVERVEITRVAGNLSQTRATEQANERINECKRTWPRSVAGSTCARSTNYYFWSGNEYRVSYTACMCMRPLYVPATCFVQRPWTRRSYRDLTIYQMAERMDLDVAIFRIYMTNFIIVI